ncbi:unnamed protein product [Phaeothamnion confervicola]
MPPPRMSDFQENFEGLVAGDRVKVVAEGVKFFHIMKYKDDGFDPHGLEGEVKDIKLVDKKKGVEITANRPVMVAFTEPKFMGHFEFQELAKL